MADDKLAGAPAPVRTTATGEPAPSTPRGAPPGATVIQVFPGGPGHAPVMPTLAGVAAPAYQPPALPASERYVLGSEIARGGMGRVVEATDTVLGRVVAYKETLTSDIDTLRRFEREIRITARLEHPSIVPVHDAGGTPGGPAFYVMRKVSGRPLERLVITAETLGQRLALVPHIVDSAQAIAHAHERGIVHRDIKPSNILIGDLGETVVIDWGLAKVIGEPDEQSARPLVDLSDSLKTRAGIVYGTPGFMAPEQLRGAPVNEGCDVYALGATLYHLLSRKPPHYAKTADEMMKAAVAAPPQPIRELVDGVPPDLSTIVDKALAHDPRVRYQNARSLAEDLQRFVNGQLVAAHHYSRREKLVRLVRRNRGVSAAIAALVVVGAIAVVRIIMERDRADAAAHAAEVQRAEAVHRADELMLAHARDTVDLNPTKAVAMVKPLAAKYWREARAIGAAARATGVAWGLPASAQTRSLELSADGRRALSAGADGVIRIHDLAIRATRTVADLHAPVMARFADSERQIVAWHDDKLVILDAATGRASARTVGVAVHDLEVVGTTAYWVDDARAVWQLPVTAGASTPPSPLALDEPILWLSPSPDGRWLALLGVHHLLLRDLGAPGQPPIEVLLGAVRHIAWAADSGHFAALVGRQVVDVAIAPAPTVVHRDTVGDGRQLVAHSGDTMATVGATELIVLKRTDRIIEPTVRKQLRGDAVGLAVARGQTLVAGATGGLTLVSSDGDRVLPLAGARVEAVYASPRSPYVVAQLEGRLLVWNLDDIQPRRLADRPSGGALFATGDQVIIGGTADTLTLSVDTASGAAHPLGDWPGIHSVAASPAGHVAIVDTQRHAHLLTPGRPAVDLSGELDFVGFATPDQLVLAALNGAVFLHDVARGVRSQLIAGRSKLIGLAWGRGRHPWLAAAFLDGALWRKNLATGVEATIARAPRIDPGHASARDGKLLVTADGTVWYLDGNEVRAWTAGGALERIAQLAKPIDDMGEAGQSHVLAVASDTSLYAIATAAGHRVTAALPSIDGSSAAMSADTGLVVVLEHGALAIIDPLARQRWTLAWPDRIKFDSPAIAADGSRVLARTPTGLLVWSIALPPTPEATVSWLDAMTNAIDGGVDDPNPGGLGWR